MIIPAGFGQISWLFSGAGMPNGAAVTMGCSVAGVSDFDEAAEAAFFAWATTLTKRQHQSCVLVAAVLKVGPNETGPQYVYTGAQPGTNEGTAAPPNTAVLVRKQTALGGREGRGRMYVPSVPEGLIDPDGELSPAVRVLYQQEVDNLSDELEAAFLIPHLLHASTTSPTVITSLPVENRVATQRRRLRR